MLICTPIQVTSQKEAKKTLTALKGKVDMAEIWLDQIKDLNVADLLKNKPLPVICVCKKAIEKGGFKGTYNEVISVLISALRHGSDYIDVPLKIFDLGSRISDFKSQIKNHHLLSQLC